MAQNIADEGADAIVAQMLPRIAVLRQLTLIMAADACRRAEEPADALVAMMRDLRAAMEVDRPASHAAHKFMQGLLQEIDAIERTLRGLLGRKPH